MHNIQQKLLHCIIHLSISIILSSCASEQSNLLLQDKISTSNQVPVEIAILMPLTTEQSILGKQYNQLIKMGIKDGARVPVHITSYDASNEKRTLDAMQKIIKRNTKIILGPLYSPLTALIVDDAKKHNIVVISMSNDPVLADDFVFTFGHAPMKQLDRIIRYCLDQGYKNFVTLLPQGQYSKTTTQVIQDILNQNSALLVHSEFYLPIPESINDVVKVVADRIDTLNEDAYEFTKPVIYISDSQQNLSLLFSSIHKYNLDKKALIIGDNRIDIHDPWKINIMFTGSRNVLNHDIIQRAGNLLSIDHMSVMHNIAYDLGLMIIQYVGEKFDMNSFLARMNNQEPYIGISGNVYFVDAIAQRKYDIIQRKNTQYKTIDHIQ